MTNGDLSFVAAEKFVGFKREFSISKIKGRSPLSIYGWPTIQGLTITHPLFLALCKQLPCK